jgi:ABC-type nitrate/sulfonate/bicarbonate transport system substrate-binding protein
MESSGGYVWRYATHRKLGSPQLGVDWLAGVVRGLADVAQNRSQRERESGGTVARRRAAGVVIFAIAVVGMGGCSSGGGTSAGGARTVRVATIPLEDWLPVWVMKEKGFAAKSGIRVQEVATEGGTKVHELVAAGSADVTYGGVPLDLQLAAAGLVPSKAVIVPDASHEAQPGHYESALVGGPDVKSWKDLEGKKLATHSPSSLFFLAARYMLIKHGVDLKKVHIVQIDLPSMPDALKAKRIDAFVGGMDTAARATSLGAGHVIAPILGAPPFDKYAVTFTLVNSDFYKTKRDALKRYFVAEMRAVQWIVDHPAEAAAIRNKHLGISGSGAVARVPLLKWIPGGYFRQPAQVQLDQTMLLSAGVLKKRFDAQAVLSGQDVLNAARREVGLPGAPG